MKFSSELVWSQEICSRGVFSTWVPFRLESVSWDHSKTEDEATSLEIMSVPFPAGFDLLHLNLMDHCHLVLFTYKWMFTFCLPFSSFTIICFVSWKIFFLVFSSFRFCSFFVLYLETYWQTIFFKRYLQLFHVLHLLGRLAVTFSKWSLQLLTLPNESSNIFSNPVKIYNVSITNNIL